MNVERTSGVRTPRFIQQHHPNQTGVRHELEQGLLQAASRISPKYLYDALGSKLFEAITCLPEYYPTRVEAGIFRERLYEMARSITHHATLIDLGAGNCEKASRLFEALQPAHYVAVDISVDFLKGALGCLQRQFPELQMTGLGIDFSEHLRLPEAVQLDPDSPRVFFYPGSSIGNFTPDEALRFLTDVRTHCPENASGQLIIGVDLVKDLSTLEAAYDDALGVTAAFNRNMLLHLNTLLGSDFHIADWKHVAFYNTQANRIEMHLEALRSVTVSWSRAGLPVQQRRFAQGERIHTENSYKWTIERFTQLLHAAGFSEAQAYTDEQRWFAVFVAHVRNPA